MMRSADSWIEVISPAAHIGSDGELERQIKRIQADALRHALATDRVHIYALANELDTAEPTIED